MTFNGPGDPREFLRELFAVGLQAVHPDQLMHTCLPEPPSGRTIVVGAGKAAASMAAALEARWPGPLSGLVVTRYGHGLATRHIEVVEAAHPVPDEDGIRAARRIMDLVRSAGANDLVIVLISGGASALLVAPAPGITLAQKQEINRALLKSGAPITEMNCVRRHLSAIKGGKLARMIEPARSLTLVISDVPGDDPSVVGSGPTIGDQTTGDDALEILEHHRIALPDTVRQIVARGTGAEPIDPARHQVRVLATAQTMLRAAADHARKQGVNAVILGDDFEIDAQSLAIVHACVARQVDRGAGVAAPPCVLVSGGESSVTVRGSGRGGRNTQFLLALSLALAESSNCWSIACDSDGIDGTEECAGGVITPDSFRRARALGLDPAGLLANNDSYSFLESLTDLVVTGPTLTNVNDFRAVLITGRAGTD